MKPKPLIHDPNPVKRARMIKAAAKLLGTCPTCTRRLPLHPDSGVCWLCANLNCDAYPQASTDRQSCSRGELCNDCAFRPGSPESAPSDPYQYLHTPMGADGLDSPTCALDMVLDNARSASAIFWCHKPFLESDQKWGFCVQTRELTPLLGLHWRPCGGWSKAFDKAHAVRK